MTTTLSMPSTHALRDGAQTSAEALGAGISVNCRVLDAPGTGVRRSVEEILARLPLGMQRLAPEGGARGARGHWWEQVSLPGRIDGVLWSPANTGPLAVRDQVVSIYDVASLDHPDWFRREFAAWYRLFTPVLARRVRRIIAPSEFTRSRLVERCGVDPAKVAVIPLGAGGGFRPPDPESSERLRARHPALRGRYLLSLGTLEPRKNLRRLFDAWRVLTESCRDVTLAVVGSPGAVFAGTGFDRPPPRVACLGRIEERDLSALYGNSDAFVFPSLYEGFGLPPLEAMACGAPVVASKAASIPEVVGDAAVLIDPLEVESIAEGLSRVLLDEALRKRLRREGLQRAQTLTWDTAAARTWAVLAEVRDGCEPTGRK